MKKAMALAILFAVLISSQALAQEHDFTEAQQLIASGIGCSEITDDQLEEIGDYYMEQMHPGEAHELMDQMMGGEGSESLRQVHINMAKRIYCSEGSGGMMSMMGGGMMGNYPIGYGGYGYWSQVWALSLTAFILVAAWLIYKLGMKKGTTSGTPLGILKNRFARGEITKKQYAKMKKELK